MEVDLGQSASSDGVRTDKFKCLSAVCYTKNRNNFETKHKLDEQLSFKGKSASKTINCAAHTGEIGKNERDSKSDGSGNTVARTSHSKWNWKHDLWKFMRNQERTRLPRSVAVLLFRALSSKWSECVKQNDLRAAIRNAACSYSWLPVCDERCRFQMFNG